MTDDTSTPVYTLVQRIVIVQIVLIVVSTILFNMSVHYKIGFFWFSFIAGIFGSSVSLLRKVQQSDEAFVKATLHSWYTTIMPFLYGGIMAGVAYFLFVSQVLSGKDGNGLLATNLFPDFDWGSEIVSIEVEDWIKLRPKGIASAGKLMVWCFLAGYSESFVSGILQRLEQGNNHKSTAEKTDAGS